MLTRREFLRRGAAGAGAFGVVKSGVLGLEGRPGANGRMVVAHIGVGGMGMTHVNNMLRFQKEDKVRIAAVCDADDNRLEAAFDNVGGKAAAVKAYRDYRYIVERKDIDAVLIATPDHWHAIQTVHACQSGKHVYVEKPASVTVAEGRAMVNAARTNRVAVQVGAQARTAKGGWHTCRAIRNGIIGRVHKVTCWHYANPVDTQPVPGFGAARWPGLGPVAGGDGGPSTGAITRPISAGSWSRVAARSGTAAPTSSAPSCGA